MTGTINLRPKGRPDAPIYSPARDLLNLYIPMTLEAFAGLDAANWSEAVKDFATQHSITEEELGDAVVKFANSHALFIRHPEVAEPADAFQQTGFAELRYPVKAMVYQRLGEVIMGGWFYSLRTSTLQNEESPVEEELAHMVAAGRQLAHVLSGHVVSERVTPTSVERIEAWREQAKRVIKQQLDTIHRQREEIYQIQQLYDRANADLQTTRESLGHFDALLQTNWWSRLKFLAKLWKMKKLLIT